MKLTFWSPVEYTIQLQELTQTVIMNGQQLNVFVILAVKSTSNVHNKINWMKLCHYIGIIYMYMLDIIVWEFIFVSRSDDGTVLTLIASPLPYRSCTNLWRSTKWTNCNTNLIFPSLLTVYWSMAKYNVDQSFEGISHISIISLSVTPFRDRRNEHMTWKVTKGHHLICDKDI